MTLLILSLALVPAESTTDSVSTLFRQVAPGQNAGRSPRQSRAVVLIHGLWLHPISQEKVRSPQIRSWQLPDSTLVARLAPEADVYSFAYSQNAPVETVASSSDLTKHLEKLKRAGYAEIVLIGHSAGGLIARTVVEDHPNLGVTRVIQVSSPNTGSAWAALKTVRSAQVPFLTSLTRGSRQQIILERAARKIPEAVAFACVVASCRVGGDGGVACRSQWSADLQSQGVPAFPLRATHWDVMNNGRTIDLLHRLVKEPLPRWDAAKVAENRKALLGS